MTPAETLRRIADERLTKGSKDWAELHRISGYIEGLEEGSRALTKSIAALEGMLLERGERE